MKKINLLSVFVLTLLIISLLAGCSSASNNETSSHSKALGKTVKLAFTVPMDDAAGVGGAKFKEVLESESSGQFQVNLFPSGQQGSMKEHWEGAQIGQIDMVYVPGSALETFVPEVSILDLPLLFPDYETAWKVIDGELGKELNKLMNEKGLQLLGVAPYGFNQLHTAKKTIESVEDLKGLKLRTIPSPLKIEQYRSWEASPTPIEFAELYTSLQSGVVDGGENALSTMKSQKIYEVQGHLTISDHSLFTGILAANKNWYDNLTEDEKSLIESASRANIEAQRKFVVDERENIIKLFEENGVSVNYLSDEAKEKFIEKSASTYEMYSSQSDAAKKLFDLVEKELGN